MRAEFRSAIRFPWTEMEPLRVGEVPSGLGTPDAFVTVQDDGGARLRVDVYEDGGAFQDLQVCYGIVVLGWGHHLYMVRPETRAATAIDLGSYFGHLYLGDGYLLVASAERLIRLQPDGSIAWRSDRVGLDGVVVEEVTDGVIQGSGEWDPPGGWRPFLLALDTGQPA